MKKLFALLGLIGLSLSGCVAYEPPYRGHPEYGAPSDRDMRHRDDRQYDHDMERRDDRDHRRDRDRRDDDDERMRHDDGR